MAKKGNKRKNVRGGAKQRMKQRQSENAVDKEGEIVRSELAHYLLSRFAWGEMSPQELQRLSMYACRDFAAASSDSSGHGSLIELQELAKIGSQGNLSSFSWAPFTFFCDQQNHGTVLL